MRTYGTMRLEEGVWVIKAEPHVAMKLKAVCGKLAKHSYSGEMRLSCSPENAFDLEWFLQRYPLDVADSDRLHEEASRYREVVHQCEQLLSGTYTPRVFPLAMPLRDYQARATEVLLKRGQLIVGDDLGLGKSAIGIGAMTERKALPALVVTLTNITRQWDGYLHEFAPHLTTHILKKGTPYPLPQFMGRTPDVIICNYHKLAGWAQVLGDYVKYVIFDECQELRRRESQKYTAAKHIAERCRFRIGLSVHGESIVELRGGPFGRGWVGEIQEAHRLMTQAVEAAEMKGGEVINVIGLGIESRGWNGQMFTWKAVRKALCHVCSKQVRSVFVGGDRLVLTDDHSIFMADEDGIHQARTEAVNKGDIVLLDNGAGWCKGEEERLVDVAEVMRDHPYAQVAVDLSGFTRHDLGVSPAWAWQNCKARGPHGSHLPVKIYLTVRDRIPVAKCVYAGRGRGRHWVSPHIRLSEWAYVLGFWLGNGWIDSHQRVCFAVKQAGVDAFLLRLSTLPDIRVDPKVRQMPGASVEVRCSHIVMASIFESVLGKPTAVTKKIPGDWIIGWARQARMDLLQGMIDSDGHVHKRNKRVYYSTSSMLLAKQLMSLLRSIGVVAGLYRRKAVPGGVVAGRTIQAKRDGYVINWSWHAMHGDNQGLRGLRRRLDYSLGCFNEGVIRSVRSHKSRPEYVYDLEMIGHPSFTANGVLVHNSATPIMNYGGEFWNVCDVICPGQLGMQDEFVREWCSGGFTMKPRIHDAKAFGTYIRENFIFLRRTRKEVGRELPTVIRISHTIDSDSRELHKIKDSAGELARIILGRIGSTNEQRFTAGGQFDMLIRQATGISKAPYVADFVRLLCESGEKVILAGWHRDVYSIWESRLKDLSPVYYTGSESPNQKEASKREFIHGKSQVVLMSLRAGVGVEGFQEACSTVVFGELDWSPGIHEQVIGRLHRDGVDGHVTAYYLIAEDGSDPIVADVLGVKREQVEGIRNPDMPLIERLDRGPNNIRRLAESFLGIKAG